MSQPRKFIHLFNCDRTYKLDAVEDLLNATKAKSSFVHMEKHYFSLAEMPDMSTKIIPNLLMNLAFFVVHAHESRLSINEDNAGIGYAKIYRALLEATGKSSVKSGSWGTGHYVSFNSLKTFRIGETLVSENI